MRRLGGGEGYVRDKVCDIKSMTCLLIISNVVLFRLNNLCMSYNAESLEGMTRLLKDREERE